MKKTEKSSTCIPQLKRVNGSCRTHVGRREVRGPGRGGCRLSGADKPTWTRQETAGEGIPAGAQWRRRAAGGALAIDMASLRSVGRCERFGALQRRMPLGPRAALSPLAYYTCCVFIERHNRRSPGV